MRNEGRQSGQRLRGTARSLAAVLVWTSAAGAVAQPAPRGHAGVIVASDVYLRPSGVDSAGTMMAALRRLRQPEPIHAYCDGAWRVHFAAWLERPPGEATLELRFDAVSRAAARRAEPDVPVFSSPVTVDPGSAAAFVNDFVVSREQGFAAGRTYEVSLWRTSGLDRTALAKGTFTLD